MLLRPSTTMISNSTPTLCFPGTGKSCFACCPPIRPAGYEHIQYQNMVKRTLRENTLAYHTKGKKVLPITGFSCWALGYLDKDFSLMGCLFHPGRNEGVDLRFRVDYGEKCERESCPEAPYTYLLGLDTQFLDYLRLSVGMSRIDRKEAIRLKEFVDRAVQEFKGQHGTS